MLSRSELTAIVTGLAVTVIALVAVAAWCAWQQETEIRQLRADIDRADEHLDQVWVWAMDVHLVLFGAQPAEPVPLEVEPDTLRADPWDSWARRTALLARYSVRGQHRASDRDIPVTTDSD